MLDPTAVRLSASLEKVRDRLKPFDFGDDSADRVAEMNNEERHKCAEIVSRGMRKVREKIDELEERRQFIEPVAINTLRSWGRDKSCPIPMLYAHGGSRISFGRVEYQMVAVEIPAEMKGEIRNEFWDRD